MCATQESDRAKRVEMRKCGGSEVGGGGTTAKIGALRKTGSEQHLGRLSLLALLHGGGEDGFGGPGGQGGFGANSAGQGGVGANSAGGDVGTATVIQLPGSTVRSRCKIAEIGTSR